MEALFVLIIISGLCLFKTITSIDNALINAWILSTMSDRARRCFLAWGLLLAVVAVRGMLSWLIVWISTPSLGSMGPFLATLSSVPAVIAAVE